MSSLRTRTSRYRKKGFLVFQALEERRLLAAVIMSQEDQLLLELVNRARANPIAEAARYGIDLNDDLDPGEISPEAKQPLAANQALVDAAHAHAQDMLDREFFDHVNPDGDGPSDRARDAGYPAGAGENIAWFGTPGILEETEEVYRRHEALFLSPPHRTNMMNAGYRELGAAVDYGRYELLRSIMVAQSFGNRGGEFFITGVAYTDSVAPDNFFTIGEAIGSANITATRNRDGATFTTTSGPSGGYQIQVPTGVYTLAATSRRFQGVITIADVAVVDRNNKVDFNSRQPSVGVITGSVSEDSNKNGVRETSEQPLAGWTVYLDSNEDGERSPDETSVTTDAAGNYAFRNLRPATYRVRQDIPIGWEQTAPVSGVRQVVLGLGQQRDNILFGAFQFNQEPIAGNDAASTEKGVPVSIDVFANDVDSDGELVLAQTQILAGPNHGHVGLNSDSGMLVYTPDANFVGTDTFDYLVTDDLGMRSNSARVTIRVTPEVGTQWRNPVNELDVSNDTFVSSIDALLILNSITTSGARRLAFPGPAATPPPFLDVNGDAFVSPIDALLVLNEINRIAAERRRAQAGGEGESNPFDQLQPSAAKVIAAAAVDADERVGSEERLRTRAARVADAVWSDPATTWRKLRGK